MGQIKAPKGAKWSCQNHEGHNVAFRYFGGVPRSIVYDNTKLAVAKILGDGTRKRTRVFLRLPSPKIFATASFVLS